MAIFRIAVGRLRQHRVAKHLQVRQFGRDSLPGGRRQDAQLLARRQHLKRGRRYPGSDKHLGKLPDHGPGGLFVQRAVEGDDPAEGRLRIGVVRARIGLGGAFARRHAAGGGVLDDHAGRRRQCVGALARQVRIDQVVVRHGCAGQKAHAGHCMRPGRRIDRGLLVGVFSIPQVGLLAQLQNDAPGKGALAAGAFQPAANRPVVVRGVIEGLARKTPPRVVSELSVGFDFRGHRIVVGRIHDNAHPPVVLGRRADHCRPAHVDPFDHIGPFGAGTGRRFDKGIEIHDRERNRPDAMPGNVLCILLRPAQQGPVYCRMQSLDATAQHFRGTGHGCDFLDLQAGLAQHVRGAARGHEVPARGGKAGREPARAGFIRNAEQRPGPHCLFRGYPAAPRGRIQRLWRRNFVRSVPRSIPSIRAARV